MDIIITILLALAGIIGMLLLLAFFMKRNHYVKREIIINAPLAKVFDFLKLLKNQDKFNKYAQTDPDRKWEYKGTDGTIGFVISWNGNKNVGEGEKEILAYLGGKMRMHRIKVLIGDSVEIVLDPYGGKGRIVKRL